MQAALVSMCMKEMPATAAAAAHLAALPRVEGFHTRDARSNVSNVGECHLPGVSLKLLLKQSPSLPVQNVSQKESKRLEPLF